MQLPPDSVRSAELAAYLTHQKLQRAHLKLPLNAAMTLCYKKKLKATAAVLARRLLEFEPNEKLAVKARQVCCPHTLASNTAMLCLSCHTCL